MKIAYIVDNYGQISETFIRDLANGFAEKTHSVKIFCNQHKNQDLFGDSYKFDDIQELQYSSISKGMKRFYLLNRVWMSQRYREKHLFNWQNKKATSRLLPALKEYQPDVAFIDFGTIATLAQSALEQLNIPFVVHFHAMDITKALNSDSYRNTLPQLFTNSSALIVPSEHIRRLLVLEGAKIEKTHVVRLGINLEGLNPQSWQERRESEPSIAFLGRFTPKKHPLALIEAFNIVKQTISSAKLTMIGDGEEMPKVKQRIEKLKLQDSVKLCGALPHQQALSIINQHWLLAQHSVIALNGDQEGFPVALAEGAALELPIVSTYHSGIPEQVIDGKTGFLVREFDYETMAEKMIELLKNPDLAEKMGKAGRENILRICNTERRVNQILDILAQKI